MGKSETPLIDLAPKMFTTIKMAQEALAKWIVRYIKKKTKIRKF